MKKSFSVNSNFLFIVVLAITTYACKNNTPPVANTGSDQEVIANTTVTLDGSNSIDADGDRLSYNWSLVAVPEDSMATLSDPKAEMPTFNVDIGGIYQVSLTVNDGSIDSATDNVTIIVSKRNNRANNGLPFWAQNGNQMVAQVDSETDSEADSEAESEEDLDLKYCD